MRPRAVHVWLTIIIVGVLISTDAPIGGTRHCSWFSDAKSYYIIPPALRKNLRKV